MGMESDIELINKDGTRLDGRKANELRPITIEAGVLTQAVGSAYVEWGGNKVYAGIYGPKEAHPRHKQKQTQAIIQCRYNMAPFSVNDRKRPGPDRRSTEISKVVAEALEQVLFLERFPRAAFEVQMEVVQAAAGTRCAALTAASVALADAGVPMRDLIPSCASGKVADTVILDLDQKEDNFGQADLPVAIIPRTGEVVLLQMDGDLSQKEFPVALDMAIEGCKEVYKLQREALARRYSDTSTDGGEA